MRSSRSPTIFKTRRKTLEIAINQSQPRVVVVGGADDQPHSHKKYVFLQRRPRYNDNIQCYMFEEIKANFFKFQFTELRNQFHPYFLLIF